MIAATAGTAHSGDSGSAQPQRVHPVALVLLTVAVFWVQVIGHEAAHELGRAMFAGDADLAARWPRRVQIAYFAGGPTFTLLVMAIGAVLAVRARGTRLRVCAAALGMSAAARVVLIAPSGLLGTASDERAIGRFIGTPGQLLVAAETVFAIGAVMLMARSIPPDARRATFAWIGVGLLVGAISAIVIGNALGIPVGSVQLG